MGGGSWKVGGVSGSGEGFGEAIAKLEIAHMVDQGQFPQLAEWRKKEGATYLPMPTSQKSAKAVYDEAPVEADASTAGSLTEEEKKKKVGMDYSASPTLGA